MSKIILKTAKRKTSVARAEVRSALSGKFVSRSFSKTSRSDNKSVKQPSGKKK